MKVKLLPLPPHCMYAQLQVLCSLARQKLSTAEYLDALQELQFVTVNMSFGVKILPLKRKGTNLVPLSTSALVRACTQGKLWVLTFEWFGLEETLKIISFQLPCRG